VLVGDDPVDIDSFEFWILRQPFLDSRCRTYYLMVSVRDRYVLVSTGGLYVADEIAWLQRSIAGIRRENDDVGLRCLQISPDRALRTLIRQGHGNALPEDLQRLRDAPRGKSAVDAPAPAASPSTTETTPARSLEKDTPKDRRRRPANLTTAARLLAHMEGRKRSGFADVRREVWAGKEVTDTRIRVLVSEANDILREQGDRRELTTSGDEIRWVDPPA
jgi:hypothetical protein